MPIESIQTVKAPKDWRPTTDQLRQIENDSRLKRMSRDDQYNYFNKPKAPPSRARPATPAPKSAPANGGPASGLFAWVDTITNALKGR